MAHPKQHYLLVMRHAQRQDELDDGWTAAEVARPGGRPWDPPLSSPRGLEQAEEAAAQLAAWERGTGARIMAVVSSPFLRCLQTAAAACRRLGLSHLNVSWGLSEALHRVAAAPAGPLPTWMWPRMSEAAPSSPGSSNLNGSSRHGDSSSCSGIGLSPEEFVVQLGAIVQAAQSSDNTAAEVHQRSRSKDVAEIPAAQAQCEGFPSSEEAGATQRQFVTQDILKGLLVTMLPPAVLEPVPYSGHTPGADTGGGGGADTAKGDSAAASVPPSGPSAGGAATRAVRGGAEMEDGGGMTGLGPADGDGDGGAAGRQADDGTAGLSDAPADAAASEVEGSRRVQQDRTAAAEEPRAGDEGATAAGRTCGEGAAVAAAPVYGVPYSPETLETAHARYRGVLRCLTLAAAMPKDAALSSAAAAATAAGTEGDGGFGGRESRAPCSTPQPEAALAPRPVWGALGLSAKERSALGSWGALWQGNSKVGAMDGITASDWEVGCREDSGSHEPQPSQPQFRQLRDGASPCTDTPADPPLQTEVQARAVLLVTHGEAVACAAATAAPWVLVYEVQHTGFVVLGFRSAQQEQEHNWDSGGANGDRQDGLPAHDAFIEVGWELLPDADGGGRGVQWMSALED